MDKISKKLSIILLCTALPLSFAACSDSSINAEDTGVTNNMATENSTDTTDNKNIGNGKNIYFAGPMFNQSEKDYNLKITAVLEEYGYHVFLPQRDGIEAALLEGKTEDELIKMIFELDAGKVKESDIVFMNMDGRVPDEGACVELGIAYIYNS